jgi:hypothetical protein
MPIVKNYRTEFTNEIVESGPLFSIMTSPKLLTTPALRQKINSYFTHAIIFQNSRLKKWSELSASGLKMFTHRP